MASRSAARTKEQIEEEKELVALLKSQMDDIQFDRYEVWHRQSIKPQDVKRHINSVTSQSCPTNVHQMMQVVCKMYLGDIVEAARDIQQEWIDLGEKQTDLPDDKLEPANELSQHRRQAPLRPDHLREAYRRRKAASVNGGALGSLMRGSTPQEHQAQRHIVNMSAVQDPIPINENAIPAGSKEAQVSTPGPYNYPIPAGSHAIPAEELDLRPDAEIDQDIVNPEPISLDSQKNIFFFWHSGYEHS
ncbi:hypothetical protein NUW58_g9813 [Xylaria curta]|uniref:Uncharacterized protein n=1 Tax=Xylaria curta TaxID=42375 RepID=A0ACC1MTA1_9PEZI|nr:hypothetical protein NUW58_g9813 [Xylaria curta]